MTRRFVPQSVLFLILFAMLSYGCAFTHPALDEEYKDSIKKTFNVHPGGVLTVDTDLGSIEVIGSGRSKVEIEVERKANVWDRRDWEEILESIDLDFDQSGNDVLVRCDVPRRNGGWWRDLGRKLRLHFIITVPEEYDVDLKTAGGSISVGDLTGKVRARTSGGSLRFGDIEGPVYGRTSGGSVVLRRCVGRADVHTSGGSITIDEVEGEVEARTSGGSIHIEKAKGDVEASTSGGSVEVEEVYGAIDASTSGGTVRARIKEQPKRRCSLSTSGGSVVVYLAKDVGVELDAHTSSGHIETDFPIKVQGRIDRRRIRAEINGGGPPLILRTSGGNIYLREL